MHSHLFARSVFGFLGVAVFMTAVWFISLKKKDASLVDRFWGMNFIQIAEKLWPLGRR
jgi:steroid 5-alpha reductase family enzyme